MNKIKINYFFPIFLRDIKIKLFPILETLGVKTAFNPNSEIQGISKEKPLNIGEVIQKNFIYLNEKGTLRASIIKFNFTLESSKYKDPYSKDFIANRPYYFHY